MKTIVVSLGGSLLFRNGKRDKEYVERIASLLKIVGRKEKLAVVVGGGSLARKYATRARRKHKSEFFADREAIKATKENAIIIVRALGSKAYSKVIKDFDEGARALKSGKIVVGAGMLEGVTTDFIAVILAERVRASLVVNLSNVNGVYSADPKKHSKAVKFGTISHAKLVSLAIKADLRKAGTHFVFDSIAAKIAARSNITLHFVDGRNMRDTKSAMMGRKHSGTIVRN